MSTCIHPFSAEILIKGNHMGTLLGFLNPEDLPSFFSLLSVRPALD